MFKQTRREIWSLLRMAHWHVYNLFEKLTCTMTCQAKQMIWLRWSTAILSMFKQICWELWSVLHMAHWHVYILFDRLTCTMTCQVKQMIGIVSCAKVAWQKLQTKVQSTSCFEMSWWGSLDVNYFLMQIVFFWCAYHVEILERSIHLQGIYFFWYKSIFISMLMEIFFFWYVFIFFDPSPSGG